MPVYRHNVLMFKTEDQPLDDHVTFASGEIEGHAGALMEFPHEYYHMPIVVWAAMGAPERIWLAAKLTT
jgi:hypothetical protein